MGAAPRAEAGVTQVMPLWAGFDRVDWPKNRWFLAGTRVRRRLVSLLQRGRGMNTELDIKYRIKGFASSLGCLLVITGGLVVMAGCNGREAPNAELEQNSKAAPLGGVSAGNDAHDEKAERGEGPSQAIAPLSPAAATGVSKGEVAPSIAVPTVPASSLPTAIPEKPAGLTVKRFVITSAIENREPVAGGETLKLGEPVYAFAELVSGKGGPTAVEIVFEDDKGRKVGHAKLDVPSDKARWRTWGRSARVNKAGQWTAVLMDGENNELSRADFQIVATDAAPALVPSPVPAVVSEPAPQVAAAAPLSAAD